MSVKKDGAGRRWVQVEAEVPGTPEEVWQAIATGPGVSSWFVPTTVEERAGVPATITANFGPGMDSVSTVTAWDPPRRFAADSEDLGPNAPKVASEWIVEARSGGTCIVRVVHSLFADSDDWDNQLESWESGWPDFFRILRLYLAHFRGQSGLQIQLMGMAPEPVSSAWNSLVSALGLVGAAAGQRRATTGDAPPLSGFVELATTSDHANQILLRLEDPIPGIAHMFALPMGGQIFLMLRVYLYGDKAAAVIARDEPLWRAWMSEHFAAADASTPAECASEKVGDA